MTLPRLDLHIPHPHHALNGTEERLDVLIAEIRELRADIAQRAAPQPEPEPKPAAPQRAKKPAAPAEPAELAATSDTPKPAARKRAKA